MKIWARLAGRDTKVEDYASELLLRCNAVFIDYSPSHESRHAQYAPDVPGKGQRTHSEGSGLPRPHMQVPGRAAVTFRPETFECVSHAADYHAVDERRHDPLRQIQ